ncbi:MAG: hypothetical protein WBP64_06935 [Nitrososphaeraceae archaeon]
MRVQKAAIGNSSQLIKDLLEIRLILMLLTTKVKMFFAKMSDPIGNSAPNIQITKNIQENK